MPEANVRWDGVGNPGLHQTRGIPGNSERIVGVGNTDLHMTDPHMIVGHGVPDPRGRRG